MLSLTSLLTGTQVCYFSHRIIKSLISIIKNKNAKDYHRYNLHNVSSNRM